MASDSRSEQVEVRDSLLPSRVIVNVQRLSDTELQLQPASSDDEDELSSPHLHRHYTDWSLQPSHHSRPSVLSTAILCFLLGCAAALLAPPAYTAVTDLLGQQTAAVSRAPLLLDEVTGRCHCSLDAIAPAVSNHSLSVCMRVWNGRWGNHIYMMMMGVKLAFEHRMQLHLPAETDAVPRLRMFSSPCPAGNEELLMGGNPGWRDPRWKVDPRARVRNASDFHFVVNGFFQYPTHLYAPHRTAIRELLVPEPQLLQLLQSLRTRIFSSFCSRSLLVAMHVRQGDFPNPATADYTVLQPIQIPPSWYLRWLEQFRANSSEVQRAKRWQDRDCPVRVQEPEPGAPTPIAIFLASDNATLARLFRQQGYQVVTLAEAVAEQLGSWVTVAIRAQDYADWWMLSQFRVLATGHSTFSLTASMQNTHGDSDEALFFVPDVQTLALAPFQPWNYSYDYGAFSRSGKQIVH